jgi:hypothetical protein
MWRAFARTFRCLATCSFDLHRVTRRYFETNHRRSIIIPTLYERHCRNVVKCDALSGGVALSVSSVLLEWSPLMISVGPVCTLFAFRVVTVSTWIHSSTAQLDHQPGPLWFRLAVSRAPSQDHSGSGLQCSVLYGSSVQMPGVLGSKRGCLCG